MLYAICICYIFLNIYDELGSKIEFGLSKIAIFLGNRNFWSESKSLSKIEFWVKNRNFGQKSKCGSKIVILIKNLNFGRKLKF